MALNSFIKSWIYVMQNILIHFINDSDFNNLIVWFFNHDRMCILKYLFNSIDGRCFESITSKAVGGWIKVVLHQLQKLTRPPRARSAPPAGGRFRM